MKYSCQISHLPTPFQMWFFSTWTHPPTSRVSIPYLTPPGTHRSSHPFNLLRPLDHQPLQTIFFPHHNFTPFHIIPFWVGHISRRRRTKTALACSPPKRIIHINIRQGIFFHEIKYNMDISLKLLFFHGHSKHHQAKWIGTSSPLKNDNLTDRLLLSQPTIPPRCASSLYLSGQLQLQLLPCLAWPGLPFTVTTLNTLLLPIRIFHYYYSTTLHNIRIRFTRVVKDVKGPLFRISAL